MALLNYRSPSELNERFGRSWQSGVSPLGQHGRFAVESYLDFHGNRFTRRFDANSYIRLVDAMSSHDVGRGRGGVAVALGQYTGPALVLGIDSDRLYPLEDQRVLAQHLRGALDGDEPTLVESGFGHDAFLIEREAVGAALGRLLGV
jgi:homoserine O-acetyltransferase